MNMFHPIQPLRRSVRSAWAFLERRGPAFRARALAAVGVMALIAILAARSQAPSREVSYTDIGPPQRVLLDDRNGERRDSFHASFVRFRELGDSPDGALGFLDLMPFPSGRSFVRGDFTLSRFSGFPAAARIVSAEIETSDGARSLPVRSAFCGGEPSGATESSTIYFENGTPCEIAMLFSVPDGSGPYMIWLTYQ